METKFECENHSSMANVADSGFTAERVLTSSEFEEFNRLLNVHDKTPMENNQFSILQHKCHNRHNMWRKYRKRNA